jgi:Ca-activated chloride channel family protein
MRRGDQASVISVSTDPRLELGFVSEVDRLVETLARLEPQGATALFNALVQGAQYLRPTDGRHVMVVLSDGTDTASAATFAQALAEVQRADAVIYSVHSTGIAPTEEVQNLGGEFVLKALSDDTGGRAFFPPIHRNPVKEARDLELIYARIAAEVRGQYVLHYYSKNNVADGRFRSIRVHVRRPGLQVYYSDKRS